MKIRLYTETDFSDWDACVMDSVNGTFLHTRRFLSYHGDRFKDISVLLETETGRLAAVFPAAVDPANSQRVISHPGITFGGMVVDSTVRGATMLEALQSMKAFYASQGYSSLYYKTIPFFYHRRPAADDIYALFRLGAHRYRCDLFATIDLDNRGVPSENRHRNLKKARKAGVQVSNGPGYLQPFWEILTENLTTKYGVPPVHTLSEITCLNSRFPDQIQCVVGTLNAEVIAGVVMFLTPTTAHCQYIGSSPKAREVGALDAIFEACISEAREKGRRWFDFGNNTEQNGAHLNQGLYEYKASYGAGSVAHEFYELSLP